MKNDMKRGLVFGFAGLGVVALGLSASPAWAVDPPPPPSTSTSVTGGSAYPSRTETTHATVAVAAIDHKTRKVTVKMSDGSKTDIQVPAEVKEFERLKVGDKIDIDYSESVALGMLPKGSKPTVTSGAATIPGAAGHQVSVSAEIVNVDAANNKVTFKGPRGMMKTVAVQDPTLQTRLPSLKPGDVIVFQYTEAVATAIRSSGM